MSFDSRTTAVERGAQESLAGRSRGGRVLLTGASGFLGRAVASRLAAAGWSIEALTSGTGTADRQADHPEVRWHSADLLDTARARDLVSSLGASHLMHLAWAPNRGIYNSPANFAWVEASVNLLEAFCEGGGERAVFAGSSAEYDWSSGVCRERGTALAGGGAYGAAKRALAELFAGICGLTTPDDAAAGGAPSGAWARIFFLFGPHEPETRLVAAVARALIAGAPARCSEGTQVRDYLFVDDAADALVRVLDSDLTGPINIASGEGIRVRDLVLEVARVAGERETGAIEWGAAGQGANEAPLVIGDVGRLRDELGWSPPVGLGEGLERTVAWWRARLAAEAAV